MEDEAIIGLFFGRDESALGELQQKYGRMLDSIARGITGDEFDAEECVNDTYLAAWRQIPPDRPQNLPAYLCRIVRNLSCHVLDRRRAQKRTAELLPLTDELAEVLPSGESVSASLEARELSAAIDRFMRTLSAEARMVFVRRYFYADTVAAISELTGMSESKITSALFRTRKKLRSYLESEGFYL